MVYVTTLEQTVDSLVLYTFAFHTRLYHPNTVIIQMCSVQCAFGSREL